MKIKRIIPCLLLRNNGLVKTVKFRESTYRGNVVYIHGGTRSTGIAPAEYARRIEDEGAGEILVNSIDRDGMMEGYDIELIKSISSAVRIPVIACGGAGTLNDFGLAVKQGGASAAAAGSFFIFHGKRRAVLITYPSYSEISDLFKS